MHGGHVADLHGGGRELEADVLAEFAAIDRGRSCVDFDAVVRGGRDPVDRSDFVLEASGAGTEPDPPAGHLGSDRDWHVGSFDLVDGAERDHRLVERDRDERGEVDGPFGLEAEHFERSRVGRFDRASVGRRREGLVDGGARAWTRPGLGWTIELGAIVGVFFERREPGQQQRRVGTIEWRAIDRGFADEALIGFGAVEVAELNHDLGIGVGDAIAVDAYGHCAPGSLLRSAGAAACGP